MEKIRITNYENNIILYLQDSKIWGYEFNHDKTFKYIDRSIFEYFSFLILSDNYTNLGNDGKYEVFLDNDTNFKHYFYQGRESFKMFFLNNGDPAICFKIDERFSNSLISKLKTFRIKVKGMPPRQITTSFVALFMIAVMGLNLVSCDMAVTNEQEIPSDTSVVTFENPNDIETPLEIEEVPIAITPKISLEDIKNKIYSTDGLEEDEKAYLYNEKLFMALLPLFNESDYMRYTTYDEHLTGMDINSYGKDDPNYEIYSGYYNTLIPNNLFIRDYEGLDKGPENKDTIAHEFIHLLAAIYGLIGEACAEIISYEFFEDCKMDSYEPEVCFVKKLMETIGSNAVWNFIFTGDFREMEERIKPYLSEEDYEEFVNNITAPAMKADLNKLEEILRTLYKNIYGTDIRENKVIGLIDEERYNRLCHLVRYYFVGLDSYYVMEDYDLETITLEEACGKGWVHLSESIKTDLPLEEGIRLLNDSNVIILKDTSDNIRVKTIDDKRIHYCDIDGKHFESEDYDALCDELIQNGYGKYVLWEVNAVSYGQYVTGNCHEGAEIGFSMSPEVYDVSLENLTATIKVPNGKIALKETIPSINDIEYTFFVNAQNTR